MKEMVLLLLAPKEEKSICSLCGQREPESLNRAELAPALKEQQPVCA